MAIANPVCDLPGNISISAYRVLFILLMLVRYRSLNMTELNRLLSENPIVGRVYNSETLTKYINTLREVGCQIPRSSSRNDYAYELLKNPFLLSLDLSEWTLAYKLLDLLAMQPDEALYEDYSAFLEELAWLAEMPDKLPEAVEHPLLSKHLSRREQLRTYRAYCRDAFTLEVHYQEPEQAVCFQLEPHLLKEQGASFFLVGLDRHSQEQRSLDVDRILSVRQLPSKNRRPALQSTVTFALYGRLAKSYRLYPEEKMIYCAEQELHIKAKVTDISELMSRLLKYGAACLHRAFEKPCGCTSYICWKRCLFRWKWKFERRRDVTR